MSIIYAVIGLKSTILCEFTTSTGNFPLIALEVLKACDGRKYVKYAANNYMFYVLNVQCTYMVMCEQQYSQRIAFSFLESIRKFFISTFSSQKIQNAKMYEMMSFSPVLRKQVNLYNEPQQVDKVARLLKETQEVSKIIQQDLQKLLARGEKITVLVQKTQTMNSLSLEMKTSSRSIRNQMLLKNWKMRILIALIVIGLIYFILVLSCGGFTLSQCF